MGPLECCRIVRGSGDDLCMYPLLMRNLVTVSVERTLEWTHMRSLRRDSVQESDLDQPTKTPEDKSTNAPTHGAVLSYLPSREVLTATSSKPKPLEQIGFTGVVIPDTLEINGDSFQESRLKVYCQRDLEVGLNLSSFAEENPTSASELWTNVETSPAATLGAELTPGDRRRETTMLLQVSIPPVPVIPVTNALLYDSSHREQRELLRSAVFWRKRFDISHHVPRLVHAGVDGLLIFTVDSWLVSINQNVDEAGIDLGSHGSMWLMLATHRDVHLHGSMLILPPNSGAVVANELAR